MKQLIDAPSEERRKYRLIAIETIQGALNDLKHRKVNNSHIHDSAIQWFNERSTEPFGYGWALEYSSANPNAVRHSINKILHKKKQILK